MYERYLIINGDYWKLILGNYEELSENAIQCRRMVYMRLVYLQPFVFSCSLFSNDIAEWTSEFYERNQSLNCAKEEQLFANYLTREAAQED